MTAFKVGHFYLVEDNVYRARFVDDRTVHLVDDITHNLFVTSNETLAIPVKASEPKNRTSPFFATLLVKIALSEQGLTHLADNDNCRLGGLTPLNATERGGFTLSLHPEHADTLIWHITTTTPAPHQDPSQHHEAIRCAMAKLGMQTSEIMLLNQDNSGNNELRFTIVTSKPDWIKLP